MATARSTRAATQIQRRLATVTCGLGLAIALPACSSAAPSETADQVVNELAAQINTVQLTTNYTAESDPNKLLGRPNGYSSKAAFSDSRIKPDDVVGARSDDLDRGGSVEVYPDESGATARRNYIQRIAKSAPIFGEYDYLKGSVLVRVSRQLTPDQAGTYQAVLDKIAG